MSIYSDDNLLAQWQTSVTEKSNAIILPDGCRDLILKTVNNGRPQWHISPLFDQAKTVPLEAHSTFTGFRLKPGVSIAHEQLLSVLEQHEESIDDISTLLSDYTHVKSSVDEALNCLATEVDSVKQAAQELGVSPRTLQRIIVNNTSKSPTYWILLARARRAARALTTSMSFAELAEIHGYADQSHMNREIKRWFNTTPSAIRATPSIVSQLYSKGYD